MTGTDPSSHAGGSRNEAPAARLLHPRFRRTTPWLGTTAAAIGALALTGWALDVSWLKSVVPGAVAMKPNAAVGLVLLGVALSLATDARTWARRAGVASSLIAATIGLLSLAEYITRRDFGIDQLLFHEAPNAPGTAVPGRMALTTAVCLILMGFSLFTLRTHRSISAAQWLAVLAGSLASFELLAFAYGGRGATPGSPFTLMALNTSLALLILSAGTLLVGADGGFMAVATADAAGGRLLRRIGPPTLLALLIGMRVLHQGEDEGLFGPDVSMAISTTVSVAFLTVVAWFAARTVNREETVRKLVETASRERDVAERANRAKSEFLSRVSHEFRTPLNAVLGFAQLLEMDDLPSEQRDSVEQIERGGRHLLDLINEVLDITRIEAGRVPIWIEPTPLGNVLRESVELLKPLADARGITIETGPDTDLNRPVMANPQQLKQILLNLLSNAIKHNRDGGSVTLSCREVAKGRLRIDVSDTGPGIPHDQIEKVFTPFERLGAGQRLIEGTGLGLTLAKKLTEAMGGALTAESTLGVGSIFSVELLLPGPSIAIPEPRTDETAESVSVTGRHRTLLLIEDNLSNVLLVERILEHVPGTKLLTAMQGGLGLELAREHLPDLILLDLHLPDIEGEEVLRKLREDSRTRDIRTVILTADAHPAQAKQLLKAGAADFLTKPIDIGELLRVLG